MQGLIDDLEQVVSAPLLIIAHDIFKNTVHFLNNIHGHHFY